MTTRRGRAFVVLAAAGALTAACRSSPTVVLPPLEVVVASGDEQYGTAGQTLTNPLRVTLRTLSGSVPRAGEAVSWRIVEGDASLVGSAVTVTDSTGSAEARLRLGSARGTIVVEATAQSRNNPMTSFRAFLVDRPALTSVAPDSVAPGGTIVLTGRDFSPDAVQNVVLFSGLRGRVTEASSTELTVEVPRCLPPRTLSVTVQLGVVASAALPVRVGSGAQTTVLAPGEVLDVSDDAGFTCLSLPGGGSYLATLLSASTVGAARHPVALTVLSSEPPAPGASLRPTHGPSPVMDATESGDAGGGDPASAFDRLLRESEARIVKGRGAAIAPVGRLAAAPPAVGARRSFEVFESQGRFVTVDATARVVGRRAAFYVDDNAPAGGYTDSDLEQLAARFDDVMHPTVTGTFGRVPDLDGSERVAILLSPAVNALTPRGSGGFVGGFFYGIDLLPDEGGSNGGEVLYALVPDPNGIHSDPRSRQAVLDVVPSVLAHELQHMIHFNERVLLREATTTEALWLSEGLAQYAEELVAAAYDDLGDGSSAALMRDGAVGRARRYLQGPDTVSLIITTGKGTLAERGASFLFAMYLADQYGSDLIRRLTASSRTGVGNIEAEVGRVWELLLLDWWSAIALDGSGLESGTRAYPDIDLPAYIGDPFPLVPVDVGGTDLSRSDSLWSSSAAYYIVTPPAGGTVAIRASGEAGGPSAPQAGLRWRVVRIS